MNVLLVFYENELVGALAEKAMLKDFDERHYVTERCATAPL